MGTITKKAFPVLNMHCAGCANNVEKTVRKLPGIVDASVNLAPIHSPSRMKPTNWLPERSGRLCFPEVSTLS